MTHVLVATILKKIIKMSYELESFNKQIYIYPSVVCVSALDDMLQEFNDLLSLCIPSY